MNEPVGPRSKTPSVGDLEIKDPQLIFSAVWADLEARYGRDHLRFPRECIWLGGAPGAGKGTNTPFVAETRGITAPPIAVSGLLTSPQAVAIKNAGQMVGDREVIGLLFEELLLPQYRERRDHRRLSADEGAGGMPEDAPPPHAGTARRLPRHAAGAPLPKAHVPHRAAVRERGGQRRAPAEARPGDPPAQLPGARDRRRQAARGPRHRHRPGPLPEPLQDVQGHDVRRAAVVAPALPLPLHRRRGRRCPRSSRTSCGNSATRVRWN